MRKTILATSLAFAAVLATGCSTKNKNEVKDTNITEEYGQRPATKSPQHHPNPLIQAQEEEIAE